MSGNDIADGVLVFNMCVNPLGQEAEIYPNGLNVVDIQISVCVIINGTSMLVEPKDVTLIYAHEPWREIPNHDLRVGKLNDAYSDGQFTRTPDNVTGWNYSNKPGRFSGGNAGDNGAGNMNNSTPTTDGNGMSINRFHFYVYCNNDRDSNSCLIGAKLTFTYKDAHSKTQTLTAYIDGSNDNNGKPRQPVLIKTKPIIPYNAEDFIIRYDEKAVDGNDYTVNNSYLCRRDGVAIMQWEVPGWVNGCTRLMGYSTDGRSSNNSNLFAKFVANMGAEDWYRLMATDMFNQMYGDSYVNDPAYKGGLCFSLLFQPNIMKSAYKVVGSNTDNMFSVWDEYGNITRGIWSSKPFNVGLRDNNDLDTKGDLFYISGNQVPVS